MICSRILRKFFKKLGMFSRFWCLTTSHQKLLYRYLQYSFYRYPVFSPEFLLERGGSNGPLMAITRHTQRVRLRQTRWIANFHYLKRCYVLEKESIFHKDNIFRSGKFFVIIRFRKNLTDFQGCLKFFKKYFIILKLNRKCRWILLSSGRIYKKLNNSLDRDGLLKMTWKSWRFMESI